MSCCFMKRKPTATTGSHWRNWQLFLVGEGRRKEGYWPLRGTFCVRDWLEMRDDSHMPCPALAGPVMGLLIYPTIIRVNLLGAWSTLPVSRHLKYWEISVLKQGKIVKKNKEKEIGWVSAVPDSWISGDNADLGRVGCVWPCFFFFLAALLSHKNEGSGPLLPGKHQSNRAHAIWGHLCGLRSHHAMPMRVNSGVCRAHEGWLPWRSSHSNLSNSYCLEIERLLKRWTMQQYHGSVGGAGQWKTEAGSMHRLLAASWMGADERPSRADSA